MSNQPQLQFENTQALAKIGKPKKKSYAAKKEKSINLEFLDVSYSVAVRTPSAILHPVKKPILNKISGGFREKQVSAIIGCSGSGKTTLLNFLSGFKTRGYKGEAFVNGRARDLEQFMRRSSFTMQNDHIQPRLTVMESMRLATWLKYRTAWHNDVFVRSTIKCILNDLKLLDVQHMYAETLSIGERKRLSIAIDLLRQPKVMFFDEPTAGLDALSALCVVSALRELAVAGKTVVCAVYHMAFMPLDTFDMLYVLTPNGQCAFRGRSSQLNDFLSAAGLQCPMHHNPIDYVMELSAGEHGDHTDTLVRFADHGKSNLWSDDTDTGIHMLVENRMKSHYGQLPKLINESRSLIIRTLIISSRDKQFIFVKILMPLLMGILFGSMYFNVGKSGLHTRDNVIMFYCAIMTVVYSSAYFTAVKLPTELIRVERECFNQWYSPNAYYACVTCLELPMQIVSTGLFCAVIYPMTGQPLEWFRFPMVFLMMILTSLTFQAVGTLGAVLFKNFIMNIISISLFTLPMALFSGVMMRINDTAITLKWIYDVSLIRHSLQATLQAVYGYERSMLLCPQNDCHNSTPQSVHDYFDMKDNIYWISIGYTALIYLLLKTCTFFALLRRFA